MGHNSAWPFCPWELLRLLLKWLRPAGPLHCPSSAVCSHSHSSCCSVVYARATLHNPFATSGLAVTDCVLSIKCSWALHSPLVPWVTPAWKERDESEMTTLFKAVADGHRTKRPCHTLGRALLPGDSAPWRQAASCFWVSDRFCFVFNWMRGVLFSPWWHEVNAS